MRLPLRTLGCHKRWKSLFFFEILNNATPPLFFIRHPYKQALQDMEFYDNFVDRFQARQLLKSSKENVLGNMMLSHWPCFSWKRFMIWRHKTLKLIFQMQHHVLEIYVLYIEKNYLTWRLSWKFSYTLRTTIL